MKAKIGTVLPASVDEVWRRLLNKETFLFITRGMLGFSAADQWPQRFEEGMVIQTRLWFFHVFPAWVHTLRVARVDHQRHVLVSEEGGGLVSRWKHRIELSDPADGGCHYVDEIDIEAGLVTWLVWGFAHLFYRYRQRRWRLLLNRHAP